MVLEQGCQSMWHWRRRRSAKISILSWLGQASFIARSDGLAFGGASINLVMGASPSFFLTHPEPMPTGPTEKLQGSSEEKRMRTNTQTKTRSQRLFRNGHCRSHERRRQIRVWIRLMLSKGGHCQIWRLHLQQYRCPFWGVLSAWRRPIPPNTLLGGVGSLQGTRALSGGCLGTGGQGTYIGACGWWSGSCRFVQIHQLLCTIHNSLTLLFSLSFYLFS